PERPPARNGAGARRAAREVGRRTLGFPLVPEALEGDGAGPLAPAVPREFPLPRAAARMARHSLAAAPVGGGAGMEAFERQRRETRGRTCRAPRAALRPPRQ